MVTTTTGRERGLLYALCMLTFVMGLPYVQCLGDDTFIYMRVIENFLESGRIEFNSGEPCYLVTSPTWFFLWAGLTKAFTNIDVARWVLSAVFHVLAFLTTWLVARRIIANPYLRLVALAVAFLDPFYLRWMWAGWELGMKITMASLGLWVLLRLDEKSGFKAVLLAGLVVGLAFLTRPEMLVLVLLGFLYVLVKFPRRRTRIVPYVVGAAAITVPWMLHAYVTFGWAVPHTIFAMSGTELGIRYLLTYGVKFAQVVGGPLVVMLLLAGLAAVIRMRRGSGEHSPPTRVAYPLLDWLLVAIWGLSVSGYVITGSLVASIYTGLFIPGLAIGLAGAVEIISPGRAASWVTGRSAAIAVAVVLLVSVGIQSKLYYRYSFFNPQFRGGVDARFIDFASKIKELTEPGAEVGLWELGVIGYFSDRYIVDFAGLATPEIVTYMRRYPEAYAERFLDDRGHFPEYMVKQFRKGEDDGMDAAQRDFFGLEYEPIWSQEVQRVGGSVPRGHYDLYVLYRIVDRGKSTPAGRQD